MPAVSLTTLRARVRELSDNASTTFVTDAATSLDAFINTGIQKLHDVILDAAPSDPPLPVATSALSFTIAAGTAAVSTPADFYELLGVDLSISGSIIDAKRFTRKERNALRTQTVYLPRRTPQYMLDGNTLRVNGQDGTYTGTLYYVAAATVLVNAGDTVSYPNGWEHYAVLYAAILLGAKEETDVSTLMALLQMEEARVQGAAKTDMGSPQRMVDVQQPFTDSDNPWEV
jgi:hypothetical protein